jgi:transposase-like protein
MHFLRNVLAHVPRRQHQMVAAVIRTAFVQDDAAQAHGQWPEVADKLRGRLPKLSALLDEAEDDVLAFMAFPKEHWPQLASINSLEWLNKEIKPRSRVVGIFPNDAAIVRLRPPEMNNAETRSYTTRRDHSLGTQEATQQERLDGLIPLQHSVLE